MDKYSEIERADLIDRYLTKGLSAQEKTTFEQMLQNNPSFKQDVENMEISREIIFNYGLREDIKRVRNEMSHESKPASVHTERKLFPLYAMRVAASLLLLIAAFFWFEYATLSGEKLYNEKASMYQASAYRGEPTDRQEIKNYYLNGDFVNYINAYQAAENPSVEDIFLAGNAYLHLNQTAKAIESFEKVLEIDEALKVPLFKDDAEYYLALAEVKQGNYEAAIHWFEGIENNDSHQYSDKVNTTYLWKLKFLDWAK